jgi:hypothetical protein
MTQNVDGDCPICNSAASARETLATAKLAEHVKEKARHDERHREWVDEHTETGSLREIRQALAEHGGVRT